MDVTSKQSFFFTATLLDSLRPDTGRRFYCYDKKQPQLGVTVLPSGRKTFFARVTTAGRTKRVTLGKWSGMSGMHIDEARAQALNTAVEARSGVDPIAKKRQARFQSMTLEAALALYISSKGTKLGASTAADYRRALKETFESYCDRPITTITRDVVAHIHGRRGEISKARTNNAMRVLRALFNHLHALGKDSNGLSPYHPNPVDVLRERKLWHGVQGKQGHLRLEDTETWFVAASNSSQWPVLAFLLFTGVRVGEAAALDWRDVGTATFTLASARNRPVELPLPSYVAALIEPYRKPRGRLFEGNSIGSIERSMQRLSIACGVKLTPGDLRRSFTMVAEAMDLSSNTLKRLLNQLTGARGVTEDYIASPARLRAASERIEREILRRAGMVSEACVATDR